MLMESNSGNIELTDDKTDKSNIVTQFEPLTVGLKQLESMEKSNSEQENVQSIWFRGAIEDFLCKEKRDTNSINKLTQVLQKLTDLCENGCIKLSTPDAEWLASRNVDLQKVLSKDLPFAQSIEIWEPITVLLCKHNQVKSSKVMDILCGTVRKGFYEPPEQMERTFRAWQRFIKQFDMSSRDEIARVRLFATPLQHARDRFTCHDSVFDTWITLIQTLGAGADTHFECTVFSILRYSIGGTVQFIAKSDLEEAVSRPVNDTEKLICLKFFNGEPSKKFSTFTATSFHNPLKMKRLLPLIGALLGLKTSQDPFDPLPLSNEANLEAASVYIMQIIRALKSTIKADEYELYENCIVALATRLNCVLKGTKRHDALKLYCKQLRAWILESKDLPFDVVATVVYRLLSPRDHLLHANTLNSWEVLDILTALIDRRPTNETHSKWFLKAFEAACTSLSANELNDLRLSRIRCLYEFTNNRTQKQCSIALKLEMMRKIVKTLSNHVQKTEELNEGSLRVPKFTTLSSVVNLIFEFMKKDEIDDILELSECISDVKKLFKLVAPLISQETGCDASTSVDIFTKYIIADPKSINVLFANAAYLQFVCEYSPISELAKIEEFTISTSFGSMGKLEGLVKLVSANMESFEETTNNMLSKPQSPTMISSLSEACETICTHLLMASNSLISKVNQPSHACDVFRLIARPIGSMVHFLQSTTKISTSKKTTIAINDLLVSILHAIRSNLSGPFDSELLSSCDKLIALTILHSNPKIRSASHLMWKSTFGKASTLEYPTELRTVMFEAAKKHSLVAPGLHSNNIVENPEEPMEIESVEIAKMPTVVLKKTPSTTFALPVSSKTSIPSTAPKVPSQPSTPKTPRSSKKRAARMALGPDEDSVDYFPVISSSNKKIKLTEKQKEKYEEQRVTNSAFVDEDSRQAPMWRTMPEIFDTDSMSAPVDKTTTTKTTVELINLSPEKETKAKDTITQVLADDTQEVIPETQVSVVKELTGKTDENTAQMDEEKNAASQSEAVLTLTRSNTADSHPRDVVRPSEGVQVGHRTPKGSQERSMTPTSKRRSAMKLNFDSINVLENDKSSPPLDEEASMIPRISCSMSVGRNRRSQNKITPNKLASEPSKRVGRTRQGSSLTPTCKNLPSTPKSSTRGRPRKSLSLLRRPIFKDNEEKEANKTSDDQVIVIDDSSPPLSETMSIDEEREKSETAVETDENSDSDDAPLKELEVDESESVPESAQVKSNGSPEKAPEYTSPEKSGNQPSPSTLATPQMVRRVFEQTTPGILRKLGSPMSCDKRNRRVHFGGNRTSSDEGTEPEKELELPPIENSPVPVAQQEIPSPKTPSLTASPTNLKTPPSATRRSFIIEAARSAERRRAIVNESGDDMLFPPLADCDDPISKIINRLLPMSGNSTLFLSKVLKEKGISTVGALARLPPSEVNQFGIKKPREQTAKQVLHEYLTKLGQQKAFDPLPEPVLSQDSFTVTTEDPLNVIVATESAIVNKSTKDSETVEHDQMEIEEEMETETITLSDTPIRTPTGLTELIVKEERATTQPATGFEDDSGDVANAHITCSAPQPEGQVLDAKTDLQNANLTTVMEPATEAPTETSGKENTIPENNSQTDIGQWLKQFEEVTSGVRAFTAPSTSETRSLLDALFKAQEVLSTAQKDLWQNINKQ